MRLKYGEQKDKMGVEVRVGDLVAYNRSGDIERGVVEAFQTRAPARQWWYRTIFVRNVKDKKLSKVKRPQSLMVLARPLTTNQIGDMIWISTVK